MEITNSIKKAAIATSAVAVIAITALAGAGVASADGGMGVPEAGGGSFTPQPVVPGHVPHRPFFSTPVYYNTPVYYSLPVNYVRPVSYVYPATYYYNYNLWNYNVIQGDNLWVSNTAEVLNITTGTVVVELNQGKTLTQIAAERGVSRPVFVSALINHAQADVAYAASRGTISGVYANSVIAGIPAQANYVVDRPGLH